LIRPPGATSARGLVLVVFVPGGVGSMIRCVDRVVRPVPWRGALSPVMPVRGIDMGCVVAVPPDRAAAGINPVGCGNLTAGKGPPGGV